MKYTLYTILVATTLFIASNANAQCPTSSMSVYNITEDSATISFPGIVGVPGFEYIILPATTATPTTGTPSTGAVTERIGLSAGTAYKAWLRSNCGSGVYTPWVAVSFSTPCGAPGTVTISNVSNLSATISWTSVSPTAHYEYVVDTFATTPTGAGNAATTNTATQNGLIPGKAYYAFVRTACTSNFSSWSAGAAFFAGYPTGISSYTTATTNNITTYPNPVNDQLHINNVPVNTSVIVINTLGMVMYQAIATGSDILIDTRQYTTGIYALKCINGADSRTIKIQKL